MVSDINFDVRPGEFLVLIGPSGCGKTTSLKMINRLVEPSAGRVLVWGKDIMELSAVALRREIGYVIQQVGLFPNMTIEENVDLVPRLLGWEKEKRSLRVRELLAMVDMDPEVYASRYPNELSGGQQQRIGVLRALAAEPPIILMDEPFGALDPITRENLQDELKNLQSKLHKTIVFVTHDMDEALKLADRIAIMKDGIIVQMDTPERILRSPADQFVLEFIGKYRSTGNGMEAVESIMRTNPVVVTPERGRAETLALMKRKGVNLGGTLVCFNSLKNGDLDLYPDYTGTGLVAVLKQPVLTDPEKVYNYVQEEYNKQFQLKWMEPFGFNNTYAIAVPQETADKNKLVKVSDLVPLAGNMVFGAEQEFFNRPDGYDGLLQAYGLKFKDSKAFETALKYQATAQNKIDITDAFSTDGELITYNLKILEDDKQFFPPYYCTSVVRMDTLKKYPDLEKTLNLLSNKINEQEMQELNYQVAEKKREAAEVVKEFLQNKKII